MKLGRQKKTTSLPKINNNIINNVLKIRKVNEIRQRKKYWKEIHKAKTINYVN